MLTSAVEWARPQLVKSVIEEGVDIHAKTRKCPLRLGLPNHGYDINDATEIFAACLEGNLEAFKILLKYSGDGIKIVDMIRSRDSEEYIPLHWAVLCQSSSRISMEDKIENIVSLVHLLLDVDLTAINDQSIYLPQLPISPLAGKRK